jgi:hypothetical protein
MNRRKMIVLILMSVIVLLALGFVALKPSLADNSPVCAPPDWDPYPRPTNGLQSYPPPDADNCSYMPMIFKNQ